LNTGSPDVKIVTPFPLEHWITNVKIVHFVVEEVVCEGGREVGRIGRFGIAEKSRQRNGRRGKETVKSCRRVVEEKRI
jgi:hypothetical protein